MGDKDSYRRRLERDPGYAAVLAARSKAWREKRKAADPAFLTEENRKKRARERALGLSSGRPWSERPVRTRLCARARVRARKKGMAAEIRAADVEWPTHCPVLGLRLDYESKGAERPANAANLPTLDRWDNAIGYVPGNVAVISLRANQLKNNATPEELEAVAHYARHGLSSVGKPEPELTGPVES